MSVKILRSIMFKKFLFLSVCLLVLFSVNQANAASYNISNCSELQNATTTGLSTDTYNITADFSCSGIANFIPLDWGGAGFSGTLNGQRYTISDITIDQSATSTNGDVGLFTNLVNGATVSNIILSGGTITGATTGASVNVGAIAGRASEGITIQNATSSVTIVGSTGGTGSNTGGLLGYYSGSTAGLSITGSKVSGAISAAKDAGGLVGEMILTPSASFDTTFTSNVVASDITVTGSIAGGLIGYWSFTPSAGSITHNFNVSNNTVNSDASINADNGKGAGIIADTYLSNGANASSAITINIGPNNAVLAPITVGNDYSGGMISRLRSYSTTNTSTIIYNFTQSFASSTISADGTYSAGGIIGEYILNGVAGSDDVINISDCYYQGDITASAYVGGLIGLTSGTYASTSLAISRSYTTGTITTDDEADGGFLGYNGDLVSISNSFAALAVSSIEPQGAFIGDEGGTSTFVNSYFDQAKNPTLTCGGNSGTYDNCTAVNTPGSPDTTYFFNNSSNPPFDGGWDFTTIWQTVASSYPTLRFYASAGPTQLTISDPTLTLSKQYDGNTTASVTAGSLSGVAEGHTVTVSAAATYDTSATGTSKTITVVYTLGGANAASYTKPVNYTSNSGAITQKQLTIADPTLTLSKTYDGNTTATVTAGALSGVVGAETVTASAAATYDTSAVGTGKTITAVYTIAGADAGNYIKPVDYTSGSGAITAKQLTISDPTLTLSKLFDGDTTAAVTAGTLSGVVGSDTVTVSAAASYDSASAGTGKTITVVYTLGGADSGNYTAPTNYTTSSGSITTSDSSIASGGSGTSAIGYVRTYPEAPVLPPPASPVAVQTITTVFSRDLTMGSSGDDVVNLQKALNRDLETRVSTSGVGSSGNETNYFGALTRAALIKFQKKYGISPAVGYFGPLTRAKISELFGDKTTITPVSSANSSTAEIEEQIRILQEKVSELLKLLNV